MSDPETSADVVATAARRRVRVGEAGIDALDESECVAHVLRELDAGRGGWLFTVNTQHLRLMEADPRYAALAATASLIVADGMPLVWISRMRGEALPERVAGSNLIGSLSHAAAAAGRSVFLLGGDPGTADLAAATLQRRDASLTVAGTLCPPPGFDSISDGVARTIAAVTPAAPDIVFVALPAPRQEYLIAQLRRELPRAWCVGVGISFSFVSGDVRRAPLWMQQFGLEWLHRLAQDPQRLTTRYLRNVPLVLRLMLAALVQRSRRAEERDTVARRSQN